MKWTMEKLSNLQVLYNSMIVLLMTQDTLFRGYLLHTCRGKDLESLSVLVGREWESFNEMFKYLYVV